MCVFKVIDFLYLLDVQSFIIINVFCCRFRHMRKALLFQGFDFVNPENSKFQKKSYLD